MAIKMTYDRTLRNYTRGLFNSRRKEQSNLIQVWQEIRFLVANVDSLDLNVADVEAVRSPVDDDAVQLQVVALDDAVRTRKPLHPEDFRPDPESDHVEVRELLKNVEILSHYIVCKFKMVCFIRSIKFSGSGATAFCPISSLESFTELYLQVCKYRPIFYITCSHK